ncbi:MAG: DoxX family protein [Bacteroidetes bacterium]|nr:DoxX family protein [Flavobacteriaceae bacterium]PTM02660.1 MAG: DoxX family protein [Bacteroidota bacterium]
MTRFYDSALSLLRIVFSLLMMTHGWSKLERILDGNLNFGDPLGLGSTLSLYLVTFAELVAPVFIIVGFKTRIMALITSFAMAVAAFIAHGADPFAKKEMALLYLVGFLSVALMGAGRYSIDEQTR